MLKVHRDSIRILLPLFLGSFIMSAVFHWLAQSGSSWFGYGANVMIGIMGSSLLSLILAIVGYYKEKHLLFQAYHNKISEIVSGLAKYEQCAPNKNDIAKNNAKILRQTLGAPVRELGDLFGEFAFLWDKHDTTNRRKYLYSIYRYFKDMQSLTRMDWGHLESDRCPQFILERTDDVILDIKVWEYGTYIRNRACEDFDGEFDTLIKLVNGTLSPKVRLEFRKTPITDKVFRILPAEDEEIVAVMNARVEEVRSREIEATGTLAEQAKELFKKGLVSSYRSRDDKIIGVTVSDKAYYYFDYKERYEKSKGMG